MLYHLSEFEILRSTNAISREYGGSHQGSVGQIGGHVNQETGELETWAAGTYQNQWLISVELLDDAAPFSKKVAPGDHEWRIRCGFCQTQIQRAPNGGWELEIPAILLAQCPTVEHVVDLFRCMKGNAPSRKERLSNWLASCQHYTERLMADQPYFVGMMNQLTREMALAYSLERGLIE